MIRLNVAEAKANLSHWLEAVEKQGDVVILCRRNIPIAELRPIAPARRTPRPLGLALRDHGPMVLPATFFEPLPDDLLGAFEGGTP